MKFSKEDLISIAFDDGEDKFTIVDDSGWVSDGKYDLQDLVFEFEGKHYCLVHQRSGSYFTDYYHEVVEGDHDGVCPEVEKVEIVTHKWQVVR